MQGLISTIMFKLKKEKIILKQIPLMDAKETSYPIHHGYKWNLLKEDIVKFKDYIFLPPLQLIMQSKLGVIERYLDPTGVVIIEIVENEVPTISILINPTTEDTTKAIDIIHDIIQHIKLLNTTKA